MKTSSTFLRVPWLLGALLANLAAQVPEYTVVNLGDLGGGFSVATSINNRGQIVGAAGDGATFSATLFSGNGSNNINLGGLGVDHIISFASSISDSGEIVGDTFTSGQFRATKFTGSGVGNINLGVIGGADSSNAVSVNNNGQIIGNSQNGGGQSVYQGIIFSGTGSNNFDLGSLGGGRSSAQSQNNLGQIVGSGETASGQFHATLFSGTGSGNVDLGTLGGDWSIADDINENGQIVGGARTSNGEIHATLFSRTGGQNSDLGTLNGWNAKATAINNSGQIVGISYDDNANTGPSLFFSEGQVHRLDALAATSAALQGITGIEIGLGGSSINDWGQIVGTGMVMGETRALLLNPVTPLSTVAPDGNSRNSKFVSGTSYSQFSTTGSGATTASLLGGVAGSSGIGVFGNNRDVEMQVVTVAAPGIYGDVVELAGTEADTFVLSLGYVETDLVALFGNEANATLGWLNDSGVWVTALEGNDGGTPLFVSGAWNTSYDLGSYGVDTASNTVWAVLNHNSSFAIINGVPEPSALALSAFAAGVVILRRRRLKPRR